MSQVVGTLRRSTAEQRGSGPLSISSIPRLRPDDAPPGAGQTDHLVIKPRRGLPGSRSVVGGLLVAVAALLAWWAAAGDPSAPVERYVVAARAVGPGERFTADHLALAPVDLGADLRERAFTSADSLIGAVATGPIGEGELVQASSVAADEGPSPERELSFPVSSTWAGGGELRPGDRIDVYATYGEGTGSQTRRVLTDVRIRRIETVSSERLGETGQQTVTVGLDDEVPVALVVNAVQSAEVAIARVSGDPSAAPVGDGHDRFDAGAGLDAEPEPTTEASR